jgi:hypothetical protein
VDTLQLPVAQVSHGSRDELEAPRIMLVETPESKDEVEAPGPSQR